MAQTGALRLAVHPYAGALSLANTYRPLQQYLGKSLNRPVEFYTAAIFDAYVASLMAGDYDIAIAPPHFAVLAMEKGYTPLFHFQAMLEPVLAVHIGSSIRDLATLRGKRIAMADKSAFIRIVVVRWLSENGLVADKDYRIIERPTHAASVTAVLAGEADAALSTTTAVAQMAADLKKQLFLVSPGLRFPHLFTLAHSRLGSDGIERLRIALKGFDTSVPEGREFFASTAFGGYEEVSNEAVRRIKPYAEAYRQMAAGR
jgi:phosphonate transport system substrate-binding protein